MKILVIGSCRNNDFESKNRNYADLVTQLGFELASRKHSIMTGGAGGLQGILVGCYKKCEGPEWTAFYAKDEEKNPNAHPLSGIKPDQEEFSGMPYPVRNAYYTGLCDGVIALAGRSRTLGEIISASLGYSKKVFQLKMGNNMEVLGKLSDLERIYISSKAECGLDFLEGKRGLWLAH